MNHQEPQLYPLLFKPVLKDYIWGGRNLETHLGRTLPPHKDIAESWEIAAHEHGDVQVQNGVYAGLTLSQLHKKLELDLIGRRAQWAQDRNKFPLLVKLLDANRRLSVQVHPNDDYALANEGNELGKTEMWVILHAEEDAAVILGLKEGATPENFAVAIEDGGLETYLHNIPVQTGDFICVPSGSLHAILGGVLITEIQQNSDVTYRVYDWNRTGQDGKPRPLHVEQALDVINFEQITPQLPQPQLVEQADGVERWELCRNRYFVVERLRLDPGAAVSGACSGATMEIWGAIEGAARLAAGENAVTLTAVQFSLLPAALGSFSVSCDGAVTLLRTYLPD
ncbi:MAG TPA: type I phosphomannose isomerase catalytic subunit [Candidatus Sulfomarinibacteraceae bacterium]|nr:type I phosphomannose isomerase catalytic subunit [Candidatus Sulfomarinibacteraceae bacterium]